MYNYGLNNYDMLFLRDKIKSDKKATFESMVVQIANAIGFDPNWLMIVMFFESGLNPQAVNSTSGASGLIQFMPPTARNLGTTVEEIRQMDAIQQLDYVHKYLLPYKGKISSLVDLYLRVFYPAAVGQSSDYVLGGNNPERLAAQNPIFDTNHDGKVTKGEVEQYINAYAKRLGWVERVRKFSVIPVILLIGLILYKI